MHYKTVFCRISLVLAIPVFMASCNSDDDNKNTEKPVSSDIGKDHTYTFTVVGGNTYTGTVPNMDVVSIYSSYPQADILMTTFNDDNVAFNCNYAFVDEAVLPLGDLGGMTGETSVMIISTGDGEIGYYSVSGSVEITNLTQQFITGNTSWALYTIHFTGLFADGVDETADIFEISGTYTIYPEDE